MEGPGESRGRGWEEDPLEPRMGSTRRACRAPGENGKWGSQLEEVLVESPERGQALGPFAIWPQLFFCLILLTLSSSPPVLHLPSVWCLPQAPRWALSIGRTWYNHTEESSDRPVCDPVIYSCWCRHTLLVALWRWRHHNLLPF